MQVALIARSTLYTSPGGDSVQVLATAKYLQKSGVTAHVKLCTDNIDYKAYDLLHFFNIIRPADILKHLKKPYVVSPVFVDYSEYDRLQRTGPAGRFFKLLSAGQAEYTKAIARWLLGKDSMASKEYLWRGHNASIRKILQQAACLLPNSENEYSRLRQAFNIDKKYFVVPNGIDPEIFPPMPQQVKDPNMVVCAARIEGIKNQLNLIQALNNTQFRLYLIGKAAPNQKNYYNACVKAAAGNIIFIDNLPQAGLIKYYSQAKVHVLPSWFETTGLSSLEAGAMGCNIVTGNRGDAAGYFRQRAFYCDPSSPASIYEAVAKAAASPVDPSLEKEIRTKFTWQQAAFTTIQAYKAII
jgi:glycosyltransferase involved in cell wall biosynthesis